MAGKLKAVGGSNDPLEHRFVIRNAAGDTYNGTTYITWNESDPDQYQTLASLNGALKGENYFVADEPTGADTYDLFFLPSPAIEDAYPIFTGIIPSIYQFEEPSVPPEVFIPSETVTIEGADAYFAALPNTSAWDNLSDEDKQKYLNKATLIVDQFAYIGEKTENDQTNEWPRKYIVMSGVALDSTVIPNDILYAHYEIAHALARGIDIEMEQSKSYVTSRGFSSVRTTYDPARIPEYVLYGVPSSTAWNYLLPYLRRDSSGVIRIHRVN